MGGPSTAIDLPDVTLVSVTGVRVEEAHDAMVKSLRGVRFAAARLLSTERPAALDPRIEWIPVPPLDYHDYSFFILQQLHRHIDTSHVLIVQGDGYVLNPERWDARWLDFDYVGAPWPPLMLMGPYKATLKKNRVGNGGFSLRRKRLLELTAPIRRETLHYPVTAEDMIICHLLFDYLTERGIRFADMESAARFSIEDRRVSLGQTLDTVFGFHGRFYIDDVRERERAKAKGPDCSGPSANLEVRDA